MQWSAERDAWENKLVPEQDRPADRYTGCSLVISKLDLSSHCSRTQVRRAVRLMVSRPSAIDSVTSLDQQHVVPNMGNLLRRGIWFPLGHEHLTA